MSAILTDLDDQHLTPVIKTNLYDFFRLFEKVPDVETAAAEGLFRWRTMIFHPWFNGVLTGSPPDQSAGQLVEDTQSYFHSHNVPAFTWWLEPELDSRIWEAPLSAAGFVFEDTTPGMAVTLADLPQHVPHADGFSIRTVDDLDMLHTWTEILIRGSEMPVELIEPFYTLISSLGIELPFRHYLGYLDGHPVSSASFFLSSGVVGIYNIATMPEARRQGLGAAITLKPLHDARQLGYRAGILQSSEMGLHVYEKLGFRQLCTMDHYSKYT